MEYAKIRSWHQVRFFSRGGMAKTLCGRWIESPAIAPEFPPNEKTCETCLRLDARATKSS